MLRKREEGGFINPVYEKWHRRIGIVVLILLAGGFLALMWWFIASLNSTYMY